MVRLSLGHLLSATTALAALPAAAAAQLPLSASTPRLPSAVTAAPDSAVVVVGHAAVPAEAISTAELRRIFLERQRFWRGGLRVLPLNLPVASPLRDHFSRLVLGRSPRELADYWSDLYFHGTQPPAVLASERAVLLFVERTPGALGYVRAASLEALPTWHVKVLLVLPP